VLLAVERNVFTAVANAGMLAVLVVLMAFAVPRYGVAGAAWAMVATELVGALAYVAWALRAIRRLPGGGT
jgi:Na+-driven multidrug efflux pump